MYILSFPHLEDKGRGAIQNMDPYDGNDHRKLDY